MIRQTNLADLDKIKFINEKCLPENYDYKLWYTVLSSFSPISFVAKQPEGSEIVGYCANYIDKSENAHIMSIAIMPEHRNQGLGTRLLLNSLLAMKRVGIKKCFLNVRVDNKAAIHVYKNRLKFKIIKTQKKYYEDGTDSFLMLRNL